MANLYELLWQESPTEEPERTTASSRKEADGRPTTRQPSRPPSEGTFKLPGSSYSEIVKVIRGYLAFNDPAPLAQVAATAGVHESTVSRNNGFLLSLAVIEGGQRKMLTPPGRELARALEYEMPDEIEARWRELVEPNEFLQRIVSAVRIRGGMEPTTFQSHIAYSAGLPRSGTAMTSAAAVADVLRAAGMIREENGKLVAMHVERSAGVPPATRGTEPARIGESAKLPASQFGLIEFTLHVQVQCTPSDLDGLATRLRAFLIEWNSAEPPASQE
jgi:hypothetical protein